MADKLVLFFPFECKLGRAQEYKAVKCRGDGTVSTASSSTALKKLLYEKQTCKYSPLCAGARKLEGLSLQCKTFNTSRQYRIARAQWGEGDHERR